jgi:PST family polysaccharide transporter
MALVAESNADQQVKTGIAAAIFRSRLGHNVLSLYAGQMAMYLAPLITVPYLARVLGQQEWGRYSFALAFSVQLALLVDYGFAITGSRTIAAERDSSSAVGRTVGAAILTKTALTIGAACLTVLAFLQIPIARENAALFWFAALAGISQGFSFSWYLYGVEKIAFAVTLDLMNRLVVAGMMLLLIHGAHDAWRFFLLQTITNAVVVAIGLAVVIRDHKITWPSLGPVRTFLRDGVYAMLSRCGFGIFTGVNTFLLGLYTTSETVGAYAGAERIGRVVTVFPTPISQALFPRISHLTSAGSGKVSGLQRLGAATTVFAGASASIITFLLAPLVTKLVLGPGYDLSATILRILSPLPLLVAANQVLVYQILFPEGEYRWVSLSLAGSTGVALLALFLIGQLGNPKAMAIAANVAELVAFACLLFRVRQRDHVALAGAA